MQSKYTYHVDHFSLISSYTIKSLKNNRNMEKNKEIQAAKRDKR